MFGCDVKIDEFKSKIFYSKKEFIKWHLEGMILQAGLLEIISDLEDDRIIDWIKGISIHNIEVYTDMVFVYGYRDIVNDNFNFV
jgi:hypothetical protein